VTIPDSAEQLDLEGLERAVTDALAAGHEQDLHVLGYGEISCVVAWPAEDGPWACKRLPVFDSEARVDAYRAVFDEYLAELAARGVQVAETRLVSVPTTDGKLAAYCIQPRLDPATLATARLPTATPDEGRAMLAAIVEQIGAVAGPDVGLDAQLSNWAVADDGLVYFDVSTPFLRDDGHDRLDTELFLASLPAVVRPLTRRFVLDGILDPYYDPRSAALDLIGNLHKEGLEEWVEPGVELANARLGTDLSTDEVEKWYRRDARLWSATQLARRLDRSWQRHVRRRPYPFLLPGRIDRKV
jgi:hypothetical protein